MSYSRYLAITKMECNKNMRKSKWRQIETKIAVDRSKLFITKYQRVQNQNKSIIKKAILKISNLCAKALTCHSKTFSPIKINLKKLKLLMVMEAVTRRFASCFIFEMAIWSAISAWWWSDWPIILPTNKALFRSIILSLHFYRQFSFFLLLSDQAKIINKIFIRALTFEMALADGRTTLFLIASVGSAHTLMKFLLVLYLVHFL